MKKEYLFWNVFLKFYSIYYMLLAVAMMFDLYTLSKNTIVLVLINLSLFFWCYSMAYRLNKQDED